MGLITKSIFLSAYVCPKRVWLDQFGDVERSLVPDAIQLRAQEGICVGELARDYSGPGVLIEGPDRLVAAAATEASIAAGAARLFEAAIATEDLLVRVDILERSNSESWNLIEVKSATSVADQHLLDIAFQRYVLAKADIEVIKCICMHLNKDCSYPDLEDLFIREDVTEKVWNLQGEIEDELNYIREAMVDGTAPDIHISRHCKAGTPCRYIPYCWKDAPTRSIFTIPRLHISKEDLLIERNVIALSDVPEDFPLSKSQRKYVDLVNRDQPEVDSHTIRSRISDLEFPIYFFDIETAAPAVPRFEGMRPYDSLCFQFSCHVLNEDGNLVHCEFLHQDIDDPRPCFVKALLDVIGWHGSVVVYNESFERTRLNELARLFPEHESDLEHIVHRMWDQLEIFKSWYCDPNFCGSNSIKRVLPVLVPKLSYAELEIQQGDQASGKWLQLLGLPPGIAKERIAKELLDYCRMDTLAMVEIHKVLASL